MSDLFVLELFSCSGGMAEGFRRAGLPITMAFDYDADACAMPPGLAEPVARSILRALVAAAKERAA